MRVLFAEQLQADPQRIVLTALRMATQTMNEHGPGRASTGYGDAAVRQSISVIGGGCFANAYSAY